MTDRDDPHGDVGGTDDNGTRTYEWSVDERGAGPAQTVIEAVAEITDTDPSRLRPLYEVIDPEGLDALFVPTNRREEETINGTVTFRFGGCTVCVHASGRVSVTPEEEDDA